MDTHICRTRTSPLVRSDWGPRQEVVETWSHEGPCLLGLDMSFGTMPGQYTARWGLKRAIGWAEGLDEFEDLLAIVEPVAERPSNAQGFVEVTVEEKAAVKELMREACDYWEVCDYASDEDEEDAMLGRLPLRGTGTCWAEYEYHREERKV